MAGKYTCPCCGYITLYSQIHDICPICDWQNDPASWNDPDFVGPANSVSLRQGQKNFKQFGASDEIGIDVVRPPSHADKRDPNWKPVEQ